MRYLPLFSAMLLTACGMSTAVTPMSVGDYTTGMRASKVQGLEGTYKSSQDNDECLQMPNKGHDLLLMFEKGKLARVDIVRGEYRTPEGIRVGSTEAEAKAAYGKRLVSLPHKYEPKAHYLNVISNGHGYVFETNGTTITRIRVGKTPELNYVEGCA